MKKILFIILFLIVLLLFTSCSDETYSLKNPVDEIKNIEIVLAENSFDFTVVKKLSETEMKVFLEQFLTIKFNNYYFGDPISINGKAVKITYQNGDYEMICHYWTEYVKNGEVYFVRKSCDEQGFNEIINKFIQTQK